MPTRKLALLLGYECNNHCIFCYDGAGYKRGRILPLTTEEAKKILEEGRKRGCNMVDILGGEPTIRKDLLELISYAKQLGYETIAITTNGQMLYYEEYVRALVEAGLNHIIFSFHGHTTELHDFHTQNPGSFERALKGLRNIKKIKPDIFIANNTVITKYNYKYLPAILEFLVKEGVNSIEFIFPHPKGRAYVYFEEIVPTLTEIRPYIKKTIEKAKKLMKEYKNLKHFAFRYIPLCYVYPNLEFCSEYYARKIGFEEKHVGPEFEDWNVELGRIIVGKVKGKQCKECKLKDICEGIWKEYAEIVGTNELKPIK